MPDRQNENTAESAGRDLGSAIKMGEQAARSAKTLSQAAAQAGTGNLAGAAVTVAKDPETAKMILLFALTPLFALVILGTVTLYALPNLLFDAATAYVNEITEQYEQELYGSDTGVTAAAQFSAALKVTGRVIADVLQSAAAGVKSLWNSLTQNVLSKDESRENSRSTSKSAMSLSENQLYQLYPAINGEAVNLTLNDRIDAILKKADGRATDISDAIRAKSDKIDQVISQYYASTHQALISQYDGYEWDGTVIQINSENTISRQGAVKLLSLYTVQTDSSLQNMNLSSLMKWLGYYQRTGVFSTQKEEFTLSDFNVTCSLNTWQGTFMPQYLMEEMKTIQEQIYWEEIRNSGIGMFDGYTRKERTQLKKAAKEKALDTIETEYIEKHGCSLIDLIMVLDCPTKSEVPVDTWVETIPVEDGPDIKILHAKATLNIDIYTRSLSDLEWMVGFWEGALPSEEVAG